MFSLNSNCLNCFTRHCVEGHAFKRGALVVLVACRNTYLARALNCCGVMLGEHANCIAYKVVGKSCYKHCHLNCIKMEKVREEKTFNLESCLV